MINNNKNKAKIQLFCENYFDHLVPIIEKDAVGIKVKYFYNKTFKKIIGISVFMESEFTYWQEIEKFISIEMLLFLMERNKGVNYDKSRKIS